MAIHTRRGDDGLTSGAGGRRVPKSDPTVRAMGDLDELACHLGLCRAACDGPRHRRLRSDLARIQGEVMAIVALLADAGGGRAARSAGGKIDTDRLEQLIDSAEGELGRLGTFILPGGCEPACRLHVARAVCRRAERAVAACGEAHRAAPPEAGAYLNRLGDALFALARLANRAAGIEDVAWPAGGGQGPEGGDG